MSIKTLSMTVIFTSLLITSFSSHTSSGMRCGNKLVRLGATVSEVRLNCGEPIDIFDGGFLKRGDRIVNVTNYAYDLGKGRFLRILEFRNGRLHAIRNGPRL